MSHSKIQILHLVAGDLTKGAARGAYFLHKGLLKNGIKSRILTDSSTDLGDRTVYATSKYGKLQRYLRWRLDVFPTIFYRNKSKEIFSTGIWGSDFTKSKAYAEASIIHLHWVNNGYINIEHLKKIDKPIVWTLRDMWPMTGGCHYALGCEKFTTGCGACPQLHSNLTHDLSRLINYRKQKYIPKSVKIIGISNWISGLAKISSVFAESDIRTIFNNVDTLEFTPVAKDIARSVLGLVSDKKIVLVGAHSQKNKYKGFDKFLEATGYLDSGKYHLCFFGSTSPELLDQLDFGYTNYGFVHDTTTLRLIYSAADVFVAPSIMDAFGKTLAESMACETPVVCFDATGPKDIVDHLVNGYKATPFDSRNLAEGIEWVCQHAKPEVLSKMARKKIVEAFDVDVIAKQYVALYQELAQSKTLWEES